MTVRHPTQSSSSEKNSLLGLFQPAQAWTAILMLVFFTTLIIFGGGGRILNIAFPTMSLGVGAFLYFRFPILYIGFTWWIWFLTPFIRRIVDYRSIYTEPSPLLLAPYLVAAITLVTVFQNFPKAHRLGGLPFILAIVGVLYGFLIGLINRSSFAVIREFLDWVTPLTFGFHLLVNWRSFPSYHKNIQRTFLWGTLVMGSYGIYQYLVAPDWDTLWLINSGLLASHGKAEAGGMRIWSTMSSAEPFSAFMSAALLLQFSKVGILNSSASVVGYLALLLTTVRSAWIGWLAGLLTLGASLNGKKQIRLILIVSTILIVVASLITSGIFSETITDRLNTFSTLEEDNSTQARKESFGLQIGYALTNFIGDGIGLGNIDSALLSILISLGWIGSICYVSGIFMLVFKLFQKDKNSSDLFLATARAVVISCLVRIPVNASAINGIGGLLLWGFLGLTMAHREYYSHKHLDELDQPLT